VQFDAGGSGLHGHHLFDAYAAGAALVDASDDPSVLAQLASLQEAGFLGTDGEVSSQVFQITRS
jgi:hypothetical protein